MTCYHPLKAFTLGYKSNGKKELKITSLDCNAVSVNHSTGAVACLETPTFVPGWKNYTDYDLIPCGQCMGCRIDRSKQWANRCLLEMEYHPSTYFVTLTYDELHLPTSFYADDDGVKCVTGNLVKRDFQLFMKRLRKKYAVRYDNKLRFFACGEYGSVTFRPHFHVIIFGLQLDDLVIYKRSNEGHIYYNSEFVQSCWRDSNGFDIGYAVVAPANWSTCAYVARYITKKICGAEKDFYDKHNINPEFTLMSRKPGIARWYYDDHPDLYDYNSINISTPDGGKKFRPPKYFDRLYDLDCPEEAAALKEQRKKIAEEFTKAKLMQTDLDFKELLAVEEAAFKNKISVLKRGDI